MAFVYRTRFLEWRTLTFIVDGEAQTLDIELDVPQPLALMEFETRLLALEHMQSADMLLALGELLTERVKDWKLRDDKGKPVPVTAQTLANVFAMPSLIVAFRLELNKASLRIAEERAGNSAPSATGGPAPTAAASGPVATPKKPKRATRA